MSILLGRHEFLGPYSADAILPEQSGVYAVLKQDAQDVFEVDFYQSENFSVSSLRGTKAQIAYLHVSKALAQTVIAELSNEYSSDLAIAC